MNPTNSIKFAALLPAFLLLPMHPGFAGGATWNLNPTSGDWNTASNWTPARVPNGIGSTATFDLSNLTNISADGFVIVKGITFTAAATNPYTVRMTPGALMFNNILAISQNGIVNNSGVTQSFVTQGNDLGYYGFIFFQDGATAGDKTAFTALGGIVADGSGGTIYFQDTTSATTGIITNNGTSASGAASGHTEFGDTSTAANSILIANGSDNGEAGGVIGFYDASTGGTARVEVFGNGNLDISYHDLPGMTVGSIEGDGSVFLGANNLTIGSNNLSTTFAGVIQDTGSLTKIGSARLILTNANTYTGGTTLEDGILLVNNPPEAGSGTGSGNVFVTGGTFGGAGTVAGRVIVGTGSGSGAFLAPGKSGVKPGTLTIQKRLILEADATYKVTLDSRTPAADKVTSLGASIRNASILFNDIGASVIPAGTVFTLIDNTAAIATVGTFSNLPDGATVTVGSNTFQADYEGGDGNDLTLTVVP